MGASPLPSCFKALLSTEVQQYRIKITLASGDQKQKLSCKLCGAIYVAGADVRIYVVSAMWCKLCGAIYVAGANVLIYVM